MLKNYDSKRGRFDSIGKRAEMFISELQIRDTLAEDSDPRTTRKEVKKAYVKCLVEAWKQKEMYGQYARDIESSLVDREATFRWVTNSGLKVETESLIVAIQDQAIKTRYRQNRIFGNRVNSKCRMCRQSEETMTHILSSCPVLARREYIQRHDKLAKLLHYNICKEIGIRTSKNWYDHVPSQVQENTDGSVTILWNSQINTDRFINANKPDIVIKQNGHERKCLLIDISVPADNNVTRKEAEKILKYADLKIEVQRMWGMKSEVVPIIIGATGAISSRLKHYLSLIPGKHSTDLLQKNALLGTATVVRKTLLQ